MKNRFDDLINALKTQVKISFNDKKQPKTNEIRSIITKIDLTDERYYFVKTINDLNEVLDELDKNGSNMVRHVKYNEIIERLERIK